ncbi:MAG: hypothetical protein M1835_004928 [Candelina submexicana]|nr:MAG: hypothetical protein M1835_004928 [Candelina submexicana]
MSPTNPYRRRSEIKETLSKANKSGQKPIDGSSEADEITSWRGLESAIQEQAKAASENRSHLSINTQSQGTKRKGRPSAGDWFAEHYTHKAKKVAVESSSPLPPSRRGSAIEHPEPSLNGDRELDSAGLRRPTVSSTASAKDISKILVGDNLYARRGRDRPSPPPTPVVREYKVMSPGMHPERRALLEAAEQSENMQRTGGTMDSQALHSPSFTHSSPPLSRRDSRDSGEMNRMPTGPRTGQESNGILQQASRWAAKANNLDRIDTRSVSANAAPAMDIDSRSISKSNSVTQSGNQTPMSMTPVTPALNEMSTTSATGHNPTQVDQLIVMLSKFSNHVAEMASQTYQRDVARKRQAKLADEYTKNVKFHGAFRGLAEQQESSKLSAQNETERLDEKLREQARNVDSIARAIVDGILSATNRNNNGYESSRSDSDTNRRLQGDFLGTKALVKEAKAAVSESKILLSEAKTEKVELSRTVQANKKEIEGLRRDIANPPNPYNRLKALEDQIQLINKRLDDVSDIPSLRGEVDRIRKQATALAKRADDTSNSLRKLDIFIHGEEGNEGKDSLLSCVVQTDDAIEHFKGELGKAEEQLSGFHSNLSEFESKLGEADARISTLENPGRRSTPTKADSVQGSLPGADTGVLSALDIVKQEVLIVKEGVADVAADIGGLRQEQEEKDELVGGDIDALRTSLNFLETEHKGMRETIDGSVARIDASIEALQNSLSDMKKSITQLSAPQTNGVSSPTSEEIDTIQRRLAAHQKNTLENTQNLLGVTKTLDVHRQSLDHHQHILNQHSDSLAVCETAYKQLDARFNSLTTDKLAKNMVHQMQELYPHASNTQLGFERIRDRFLALERQMQEASTSIARLSSGTTGSGIVNTEEMNRTIAAGKRIGVVEAGLGKLNQDWQIALKDLAKLKTRVDNIWQHSLKEFGSLDVQIRNVNDHLGLTPLEEEDDVSELAAGQGSSKRKRKRNKIVDSDAESTYEDAGEIPTTDDDE